MKTEPFIDRHFRKIGEEILGKECMNKITSSQIEEARVFAFNGLADLTAAYGKQDGNVIEELFCTYVREVFA